MKLSIILLLTVPVVAALIEDGVVPPQPEALVSAVETPLDEDRDLVSYRRHHHRVRVERERFS
jgi:hypothetical protein